MEKDSLRKKDSLDSLRLPSVFDKMFYIYKAFSILFIRIAL